MQIVILNTKMSQNHKKKHNKQRGKQKRTSSGRGVNPLKEAENARASTGDVMRLPKVWCDLPNSGKIWRFRRTVDGADINQIAGGLVFGSYIFKLSQVDVPTEFSSLFDQYRFSYVKLTFRPRFNFAALAVNGNQIDPRLYTVIDYDDGTNLTALAGARQYQTLLETRFDQDHVRFIKPHSSVASYASGVFTSFDNVVDRWHDLAYPDIEHYGIKFVIEAGGGAQTNLQAWSVQLDYYLEFKTVR